MFYYSFIFLSILHVGYSHPFASPQSMLKHLFCSRIPFPCMNITFRENLIFRKECCYGDCQACKDFQRSDRCILNCPSLFNDEENYRWMEFQQVRLDNGKFLKELQPVIGSLAEVRTKFAQSLTKYREHYYKYRWLNLTRLHDVENLDPTTIYMQTDYSAMVTLDSQNKMNCVGHGVCVLQCWAVLHSPRQEYYTLNGERHYYTFYECDHIRVVSPATGKQKDQDWFLHCKVFEELLRRYKHKIPSMDTVIVWTDGAPNQYKCRYNFYWLSTMFAKTNINIIHRFAATAQFKGVHDKIGQVAKWKVQ